MVAEQERIGFAGGWTTGFDGSPGWPDGEAVTRNSTESVSWSLWIGDGWRW